MYKKEIYVVQFGTGSDVNLIPLAAGQLVAQLKEETALMAEYDIGEIIFRRDENPVDIVNGLDEVLLDMAQNQEALEYGKNVVHSRYRLIMEKLFNWAFSDYW